MYFGHLSSTIRLNFFFVIIIQGFKVMNPEGFSQLISMQI